MKNYRIEINLPPTAHIQKKATTLLFSGPLGSSRINLSKYEKKGVAAFSVNSGGKVLISYQNKSAGGTLLNSIRMQIDGVLRGYLIGLGIVGVGYRGTIRSNAGLCQHSCAPSHRMGVMNDPHSVASGRSARAARLPLVSTATRLWTSMEWKYCNGAWLCKAPKAEHSTTGKQVPSGNARAPAQHRRGGHSAYGSCNACTIEAWEKGALCTKGDRARVARCEQRAQHRQPPHSQGPSIPLSLAVARCEQRATDCERGGRNPNGVAPLLPSMEQHSGRGETLHLKVGKSHDSLYRVSNSICVFSPDPTRIFLFGVDKNQVTQAAAKIRQIRPPDGYKGKGLRLINEIVALKQGKHK